MINVPWTDQREALLRELHAAGFSFLQIARRMGGFAHTSDEGRSAVIGKSNRLGLPKRAVAVGGRRPQPRRTTLKSTKRVATKFETDGFVPPPEEIVIPLAERKQLKDLEDGDCRWPIGDPQADDFHFCAKEQVLGLPYCPTHCKRAFHAPQPRRAYVPGVIRKETADA